MQGSAGHIHPVSNVDQGLGNNSLGSRTQQYFHASAGGACGVALLYTYRHRLRPILVEFIIIDEWFAQL